MPSMENRSFGIANRFVADKPRSPGPVYDSNRPSSKKGIRIVARSSPSGKGETSLPCLKRAINNRGLDPKRIIEDTPAPGDYVQTPSNMHRVRGSSSFSVDKTARFSKDSPTGNDLARAGVLDRNGGLSLGEASLCTAYQKGPTMTTGKKFDPLTWDHGREIRVENPGPMYDSRSPSRGGGGFIPSKSWNGKLGASSSSYNSTVFVEDGSYINGGLRGTFANDDRDRYLAQGGSEDKKGRKITEGGFVSKTDRVSPGPGSYTISTKLTSKDTLTPVYRRRHKKEDRTSDNLGWMYGKSLPKKTKPRRRPHTSGSSAPQGFWDDCSKTLAKRDTMEASVSQSNLEMRASQVSNSQSPSPLMLNSASTPGWTNKSNRAIDSRSNLSRGEDRSLSSEGGFGPSEEEGLSNQPLDGGFSPMASARSGGLNSPITRPETSGGGSLYGNSVGSASWRSSMEGFSSVQWSPTDEWTDGSIAERRKQIWQMLRQSKRNGGREQ